MPPPPDRTAPIPQAWLPCTAVGGSLAVAADLTAGKGDGVAVSLAAARFFRSPADERNVSPRGQVNVRLAAVCVVLDAVAPTGSCMDALHRGLRHPDGERCGIGRRSRLGTAGQFRPRPRPPRSTMGARVCA